MKVKKRQVFNEPGHGHELTFSTYRRIKVFNDPECARIFLETLDRARQQLGFQIHAYVVMPEHVHVLILPPEGYDVSKILHRIKQPSSMKMLTWLRRTNPRMADQLRVRVKGDRLENRLWQQGGGCDRNVYNIKVAQFMIDYIHMNPVRRKLCENPRDWPWSSAPAYEELETFIKVDFPQL